MSESSLPLTDGDGSGGLRVNDQTIGGTAVSTQYVAIGQTGTKTYTARFQDVSIATANAHVLELMGDGTAYPKIHEIYLAQAGTVATRTTAEFTVVRLSSSGTGGTAVSARPLNPANTNPYAGTIQVLPSSGGGEAQILLNKKLYMAQSDGVGAGDELTWTPPLATEPIISGNGTASGICIKNLRAVTGGTVAGYVVFTADDWDD